jgi:hypothetical protein
VDRVPIGAPTAAVGALFPLPGTPDGHRSPPRQGAPPESDQEKSPGPGGAEGLGHQGGWGVSPQHELHPENIGQIFL